MNDGTLPMSTLAERLKYARTKAGMSQSALARAVGIKPQSVQAIEAGDAKRTTYASEFARILGVDPHWLATGVGKPTSGNIASNRDEPKNRSTSPPIDEKKSEKVHTQPAEEADYYNVGTDRLPAPHLSATLARLPVKGTAVAGEHERGDFRFNGEDAYFVRRPSVVSGVQSAFAVHVRGDSMSPRYYDGELVVVHPGQPPKVGDTVLVELKPTQEGDNGAAMVKILVSKTSAKLRLKQFNPPNDKIEFDMKRVKDVFRVIPYSELLDR